MTIKCTSLETSRLLKEAGFRQDTTWRWCDIVGGDEEPDVVIFSHAHKDMGCTEICAATTTDELLEELPEVIHEQFWLIIEKDKTWYVVKYYSYDNGTYEEAHMSETLLPEAIAQMWLWLRKEKLL